jgi:hypothetical protein
MGRNPDFGFLLLELESARRFEQRAEIAVTPSDSCH